jgi:HAD superfamily hydrolase (TIGR01549 family)
MITTVVFDIGETLIGETRIWTRWARRLGVPELTFLGVLGGMIALDRSHREVFEFFRPGFDLEGELERWRIDDPTGMRENFDSDDLYPDVRTALGLLREIGATVVIAGNQPPQARAALEVMELEVAAILTSADLGVEKPSPGFFEAVCEAVGVAPDEVIYVGDRLDNDVLPAQAAGMRGALIRRGPWGYLHSARPEAARADYLIDSLEELAAIVRGS